MSEKINIKNKKAFHDFFIEEKFDAGIVLYGTEIKAIRAGKAGLTDSYCVLLPMPGKPERKELWIKMNISEYSHGNLNNHEPRRDRKLLLKAREIKKLERKTQGKGVSIIPLRVYINEKGLAKVEISIATGKKQFDKRETLKQSDSKRELDRVMKKNV
jgi:SsrA-binding protein